MTAPKIAETDAQIQALRQHISEECVSIASCIDSIPAGLVTREMRERWLRELRQAVRAMAVVEERLVNGPRAKA